MLSVNGTSVVEVDHYYAVEVLKKSGQTLHLVVTRDTPNSTRYTSFIATVTQSTGGHGWIMES